MGRVQGLLSRGSFGLRTERLGPLPIVNHFLSRMGLGEILQRHVPTQDRRVTLSYALGLGLLRSILVEREPIYRQQETVRTFAPEMYALHPEGVDQVSDDRIGRALDRLFDADRAALLTEVVIAVAKRFEVRCDELHNDSTTIRFTGQYRRAQGRRMRGQRAPFITYGYSKDHRPDLKQLLFSLTASADGGVPVQFRCSDGNTNDSVTHIETWKALRAVAGRPDFLYVADSKLCSRENMDYIYRRAGRFVTVLPRSRLEDGEFRKWIQTHEPEWEKVWDRPNPRRKGGPRDRWYVCRAPLPSREAWPVTWVFSTLLALRREEHTFRQLRRGRPGSQTPYRRITRRRWGPEWKLEQAAIDYDRKSDGMYPLLSNDRSLPAPQVLQAHKGPPAIEKRFQQIKTVHEIAPVLLKNEGRIEALFTLYFLALLVQALIERDLRRAMKREKIPQLPLYPEERQSKRPTTEQVLRLFSLTERHTLLRAGQVVQVFPPELTALQKQILALLHVPERAFRPPLQAGKKIPR